MILSLLLLISCAHTPISVAAEAKDALDFALKEATRVSACMVYLQEILDIQDKREDNNTDMAKFTELYNTRRISLEEHKDAFGVWHTKESRLYSDVTALYDTSYSLRCFE